MNPRERVLCAFRHQETDRVPFNMRFAPDLARKVSEAVGQKDLEAHFDFDIRFVRYATDQATGDFSRYLCDLPEGATVSPWGGAHVKGTFHHFLRRINPMRDLTLGDLDDYPWPEFEPKLDEMRKQVEQIQAAGYAAVSQYESGSYEQACALRGQEQFLMDLAGDPEFAEALLTRIAEIKARKAAANAKAGADVVWIGDDLGTQKALVFSPDTWRRLIRPPLQRIVDAIRAVRKDVLIAYHSCGHVEPVAGELADVGIDVLESVQPEANDVAKLKALHGDRLAFWGTMGAQSTFSHGAAEDVRKETRERMAVMGKGGGLMLAPAHVLEPEVPVENVLAFVDEIRK
ncbi:MAG: uroporphyrinogen decarboxylase family protein [Planctomycetota bacterium]